jgi:hypothetical protein
MDGGGVKRARLAGPPCRERGREPVAEMLEAGQAGDVEAEAGGQRQKLPKVPFGEEVGMDMTAFVPKDAVRRFFNRYTNHPTTADDYFYRLKATEATAGAIQAELVTPSFYLRVFEGRPCTNKKSAEASAAEAFCSDPQVLAAAALLLPSMKSCRKFAGGAGVLGKQRAQSAGMTVGQLKTERAAELQRAPRG